MLINKITIGFVTQEFDTETGAFTEQSFTAGDQVDWETINGDPVDLNDLGLDLAPYLSFDMVQPPSPTVQIDFIDCDNPDFRLVFDGRLDKIKLASEIVKILRPHGQGLSDTKKFLQREMITVPRDAAERIGDLGVKMRVIG